MERSARRISDGQQAMLEGSAGGPGSGASIIGEVRGGLHAGRRLALETWPWTWTWTHGGEGEAWEGRVGRVSVQTLRASIASSQAGSRVPAPAAQALPARQAIISLVWRQPPSPPHPPTAAQAAPCQPGRWPLCEPAVPAQHHLLRGTAAPPRHEWRSARLRRHGTQASACTHESVACAGWYPRCTVPQGPPSTTTSAVRTTPYTAAPSGKDRRDDSAPPRPRVRPRIAGLSLSFFFFFFFFFFPFFFSPLSSPSTADALPDGGLAVVVGPPTRALQLRPTE